MTGKRENREINILAEFRDKGLEEQYLQGMGPSKKHLQKLIFLFGCVYLFIGLFDIYYFQDIQLALPGLMIRLAVFLCAGGVCLFVSRADNSFSVSSLLSAFELLLFASYLLLLYQQRAQGFMEQCMAVMVVILVVFLIPNRWVNSMAVSVAVSVLFMVGSRFYIDHMPLYMQIEAALYIAVTILVSGVSGYRINVYQRTQYMKERQLKLLSETDRLTKIYNRQKFDEAFEEWCRLVRSYNTTFSMVMFDLDNFKMLNDTHGHLTGDKVLIKCVDAVKSSIREQDIFARWGGEEFIILLPFANLSSARDLAERLRLRLEDLDMEHGCGITASFGVAEHEPGETYSQHIKRLDTLLYKAKQEGKNTVRWEDREAG